MTDQIEKPLDPVAVRGMAFVCALCIGHKPNLEDFNHWLDWVMQQPFASDIVSMARLWQQQFDANTKGQPNAQP